MKTQSNRKTGYLALKYCGKTLPLSILKTQAGFYIGTVGEDGLPCSRESRYFSTAIEANAALASGEWTQRTEP